MLDEIDDAVDDFVDIAELFKEYKRDDKLLFDEILFNTWQPREEM